MVPFPALSSVLTETLLASAQQGHCPLGVLQDTEILESQVCALFTLPLWRGELVQSRPDQRNGLGLLTHQPRELAPTPEYAPHQEEATNSFLIHLSSLPWYRLPACLPPGRRLPWTLHFQILLSVLTD